MKEEWVEVDDMNISGVIVDNVYETWINVNKSEGSKHKRE